MKKVLFISPTPTHVSNAGNRLHIKSLAAFFKVQHCDVDFLYLRYEDFDQEGMFVFFEGRLTVVPREVLYDNQKTLLYILKKCNSVVARNYRRMQLRLGNISPQQFLYNSELDQHFPHFAIDCIKKLAAKKKYDIVVCEYASMSKALDFFGNNVFKILDTHDVFADRYKVYLNNNLAPDWVSLYKDQEKKAIKRADLVLAVSEKDECFFRENYETNTAIYNAIPAIVKMPPRAFEYKLLYIASGNDINVATLDFFIKEVFPTILQAYPQTQLLVGGNICERVIISSANIKLTGQWLNVGDFYAMGDIVINPETSGTGYKVKALEALAFGMPLVTTRAGGEGTLTPFNDHLFLSETIDGFAEIVIRLFKNLQLLPKVSTQAQLWVKEYRHEMLANLSSKLPLE